MPTATVTVTEVPAADVAAPPKSRKKLFLVIGLVVLLLGVGGYFAKGLLGGPAAAEPDPKTVAGTVETLSPVTLNLADGRYLKLTLALQLSKAAGLEAGTVGEGAAVAARRSTVPRRSTPRSTSSGRRTYAQLLATGGPGQRPEGAVRGGAQAVRRGRPAGLLRRVPHAVATRHASGRPPGGRYANCDRRPRPVRLPATQAGSAVSTCGRCRSSTRPSPASAHWC